MITRKAAMRFGVASASALALVGAPKAMAYDATVFDIGPAPNAYTNEPAASFEDCSKQALGSVKDFSVGAGSEYPNGLNGRRYSIRYTQVSIGFNLSPVSVVQQDPVTSQLNNLRCEGTRTVAILGAVGRTMASAVETGPGFTLEITGNNFGTVKKYNTARIDRLCKGRKSISSYVVTSVLYNQIVNGSRQKDAAYFRERQPIPCRVN